MAYLRLSRRIKQIKVRNTLENDFYQLMLSGPPLDERKDLWDEFRKALSENAQMKEQELLEFLTSKDYAREGYWWFDPEEWR